MSLSKICARCGGENTRSYHAYCYQCVLNGDRERRKTPKGRAAYLLSAARDRAGKDAVTVSLDQIAAALERGVCQATGLALNLSSTDKNPRSPSLDRIDPTGPYSPENTRVVCWDFNLLKSNRTDEELRNLFTRFLERHNAPA